MALGVLGDDEVSNQVALPVGMTVAGRAPTCARILAWNTIKRRGIKQPDSRAVALRKQKYITAFPAFPTGRYAPVSAWNALFSTASSLDKSSGAASPGVSPCLHLLHPLLLSDWDRFQAMNESVGARLSHGKSGVHGMGVFARLPIKAGDWVVEYQGKEPQRVSECLCLWFPVSFQSL